MTNQSKLLIYSFISFALFIAALFLYTTSNHQTATQANTEPLTAYEYTITSINSDGINGKSTSDNSGIYLTHENVKGLSLNKSDVIKVEFPKNDYETITKVEKVNNLIAEQFTITQISNGQYQATNNHTGTDKAGLFFSVEDIQGNTSLSVNDQVKAYYEPLEGEDEFIKVVKVN
jgi:hypothetical protein